MRHRFDVRVGPRRFRIGSDWRAPIAALEQLYASYPQQRDAIPHCTVRLEATSVLRRWLRPRVAIQGDYVLPEAVPVSLAHGLLAAEMGMNLQLALGERRFLLLHASAVERDGRALLMPGESGSGKSTLAALLGTQGWRFLGDEFALLDPWTGLLHPFPRPASLKNAAIAEMQRFCPRSHFGPVIRDTPKGEICHMVPEDAALAAMERPAAPALILFPRFGQASKSRALERAETFVRLTQASTNYVALGEAGFDALARLVAEVPAHAVDYPDTESGLLAVEALWR